MRRDGTMRLADFVSAILHLTMAFEVFKSKDVNQDNQIKMNLNEVRKFLVRILMIFINSFFSVDKICADLLITQFNMKVTLNFL